MKMTEQEIDNVLIQLRECELSSYKISQLTLISQATIGNYRRGLTRPTMNNALTLKHFLDELKSEKNDKSCENDADTDILHIECSKGKSVIDSLVEQLYRKDLEIDRLMQIINNLSLQKL